MYSFTNTKVSFVYNSEYSRIKAETFLKNIKHIPLVKKYYKNQEKKKKDKNLEKKNLEGKEIETAKFLESSARNKSRLGLNLVPGEVKGGSRQAHDGLFFSNWSPRQLSVIRCQDVKRSRQDHTIYHPTSDYYRA